MLLLGRRRTAALNTAESMPATGLLQVLITLDFKAGVFT